MGILGEIAKFFLRKAGVFIRWQAYIPYGVEFWSDLKRLSNALRKPISIVFDVGANIGETSLASFRTFPAAKVYAFEPHPTTFSRLVQTVKAPCFFPNQVALSASSGKEVFYEYEGGSLLNSLVPNSRFARRFKNKARQIEVEKTTLDSFCNENGISHIDLLKIDTEGGDFSVLQGANGMLKAGAIEFVYFEFNDVMPKEGTVGGSFNEISEYLSRFGFHFVATYTDNIATEGEMFVVANALMVRTGT